MSKGAAKSRRKSRPGKNGGALNTGGNEGNVYGAGRPPDEFKARMREIASSDGALAFLKRCADGEFGEQFAVKAQQYAAERGYGKEAQVIAGDKDRPLEVVIRSE